MNTIRTVSVANLNRKQLTTLALDLGTTPTKLRQEGIPEPTSRKERTMQRLRLEDRFNNDHR